MLHIHLRVARLAGVFLLCVLVLGARASERANPCDGPAGEPGRDPHCRHGGSSSGISRGDFNGDGFADLAIGVPNESVVRSGVTYHDAGEVIVIYGGALNVGLSAGGSGVPASQAWTQDSSGIIDQVESDDRFGAALAAGDFDGDGLSDLAVAVPGERGALNERVFGAIHVIYGSGLGLSASGDRIFFIQDLTDRPFLNLALAPQGEPPNLAWGDFNGDGYGDLAMRLSVIVDTNPTSQEACTAVVAVMWGSSTGLDPSRMQYVQFNGGCHQDSSSRTWIPEPFTLAAGQLDATTDPFSDFVAGFPRDDRIRMLHGGRSGFTSLPVSLSVPGGESLAIADFDGNGWGDVAVGAPFETVGSASGAGAVRVLYGNSSGVGQQRVQLITQNGDDSGNDLPGVAENFDSFGAALAAGDFNADRIADLAIGIPDEDLGNIYNAGTVEVIYGRSDGLNAAFSTAHPAAQLWAQDSPGIDSSIAEQGDSFGASLSAWNFGRGAGADLAIGVPYEGVITFNGANVSSAGMVNVIYSSGSPRDGLRAEGEQAWHQDSPGIPDEAEGGDFFGSVLY